MRYQDQLALRTWEAHVKRASMLATEIESLPRHDLLDLTQASILRLALADGIEVIEGADEKYFQRAEAQRLRDHLSSPFRINSLNVFLTPVGYQDFLLATGVLGLHDLMEGRKQLDAKERLVTIRLPGSLKARLDRALKKIQRGARISDLGLDTSSACIRLVLDIGLFWMECKVDWEKHSPGNSSAISGAPTPLPRRARRP